MLRARASLRPASPVAPTSAAVNLGQGFPDWPAPDFVVEAAAAALRDGHNQYCRAAGHPLLCEAVAAQYSDRWGREVDPTSQVVVTEGATGGVFTSMQALLQPGDEVVLMEPTYDCYAPAVEMARGTVRRVSLHLPGWERGSSSPVGTAFGVDADALAAAVSPNTRAIVVNTPHNPTGRVMGKADLDAVAAALRKADALAGPEMASRGGCVIVADEVYDELCFDQENFRPVASHPGLEDRTLTLGSAGKSLSVTGWKVGWAVGPAPMVAAVAAVNQWTQFCVATPLQVAVANALGAARARGADSLTFFDQQRKAALARRELLVSALNDSGLPAIVPEAGFFVLADTAAWRGQVGRKHYEAASPSRAGCKPAGSPVPDDVAFCRFLTEEVGVTAIPPTAFYSPATEHLAAPLARFALCKQESSISEAGKRLRRAASERGIAGCQ